MPGPDLRVRLLAGFEVEVDGHVIPAAAWQRRGSADLVKLLALAPGRVLSREQIGEALWPTLAPERGAVNVRRATHYARRALGVREAVLVSGGFVQLAPGGSVETDAERFEDAAADALARGDGPACRDAAALYTGDLLPLDRYAPWCSDERERLRARFLDVLAGSEQWDRLVDEDPANERAHQSLMRAQLDRGDRRGVLGQFARLRAALEELGAEPGAASVDLYQEALAVDVRDAPTPAERARTLLAWGMVHWERADLAEAERAALEVRALAVDAGLGREFAGASELLAAISVAHGTWQEFFARSFVEAIEHHPDLAPFVFDAHVCMSEFSLHQDGGLAAARGLATRLIGVGDRLASRRARSLGMLLRGEAALLAGDTQGARTCLGEATRLLEGGGQATATAVALERLAQVDDAEGEHEAAAKLHRRALEVGAATAMAGHLIPFVYAGLVAGAEPSRVPGILSDAGEAMRALDVCEPCSMGLHLRSAGPLAALGDVRGASHHLEEAERIAGRWSGGPWHAAVAEARALVLRAQGSGTAEVDALFAQAQAGYRASGWASDAARCADATSRRGRSDPGNAPGTPLP